jgi:signal transduction histidine kinase
MEGNSLFSDLEKSFESFNSSISNVRKAFGEISRQIDAYRDSENVPRDYLKVMAGNLAHEIRNPLGGIATFVELLSDSGGKQHEKNIEGILEGVYRIDKIVENLIVFSRPMVLQTMRCNFCDTVKRAVESVRDDFNGQSPSVNFSLRLPENEIYIDIDPLLMLQAIQNILCNAIEVMSEGGTVTLALIENQMLGKMVLCIADQGNGLSDQQFERPFYPFYTTKTNGMGLGLPTTRLIVEKHGGKIWLKNGRHTGAVVIIKLPIN